MGEIKLAPALLVDQQAGVSFICSSCKYIVEDPVTCDECDANICRECVKSKATCPEPDCKTDLRSKCD